MFCFCALLTLGLTVLGCCSICLSSFFCCCKFLRVLWGFFSWLWWELWDSPKDDYFLGGDNESCFLPLPLVFLAGFFLPVLFSNFFMAS